MLIQTRPFGDLSFSVKINRYKYLRLHKGNGFCRSAVNDRYRCYTCVTHVINVSVGTCIIALAIDCLQGPLSHLATPRHGQTLETAIAK